MRSLEVSDPLDDQLVDYPEHFSLVIRDGKIYNLEKIHLDYHLMLSIYLSIDFIGTAIVNNHSAFSSPLLMKFHTSCKKLAGVEFFCRLLSLLLMYAVVEFVLIEDWKR